MKAYYMYANASRDFVRTSTETVSVSVYLVALDALNSISSVDKSIAKYGWLTVFIDKSQ